MWGHFRIHDLEKLHREPSPRSFGLTLATIGALACAFWSAWIWLLVPAALFIIAVAIPQLLQPISRLWFLLGLFMGWLMSPIVLSVFYFLVFVPMVLIVKLFGHKPFPKRGWVTKNKTCQFTRNF